MLALRSLLFPFYIYFAFSLPAFAAESTNKNDPQSIQQYTKSLERREGFYTFYYQSSKDKVYLQIEQFNEPFLFQSSLPQGIGSNDIGLDRGQLGDTRLVQFERYGNKVLLKQLNTEYRVESDNQAEVASIDEAFADSVIAGFKVVASEENKVLVDYTAFLFSDIHNIAQRLKNTKQGNFQTDASRSGVYLQRSKSFVDNTELEALVTYKGSKPGKYLRQVTPSPDSVSVHLHHSLIRLPDDQYKPRAFHPFSGFWKMSYKDYGTPIDADMEQKFIPRHRMDNDNPIIYYLDPGIPEPVMSALREGALWWNEAFTNLGYKNGFQVKVLPEGADPMDVRYNVIQWVHRATRGWSYGASVIDPRTGEILKGHVTLGSLRVRQDLLIALGVTSPYDKGNTKITAQKEMALARIRQLSAHEVGHTLGIAHNFAASVNGRESVMDYPHPMFEIVKGKISLKNAYDVGMGEWDKHVIAYGYQAYDSDEEEAAGLVAQINKSRASGLLYHSDPDSRGSGSASQVGHLWDNGADPLIEFERVSEIRQLALSRFGEKSLKGGESLSSLQEKLVPIYLLHRYQLDAVVKVIGGVDYSYENKGDYSDIQGVKFVDSDRQQKAIDAMLSSMSDDYLSLSPEIVSIITPKTYGESRTRESFVGRTGITFDPISAAESSAGYSLKILLESVRLNRLAQQHAGDHQMPGVGTVLQKLFTQVVSQADSSQLAARISLISVNAVMHSLNDPNLAPEVKARMLFVLNEWHAWFKQNQSVAAYFMLANHFDIYWKTGEWPSVFDVKPLPPGSPI